jgi:hypothetical protein
MNLDTVFRNFENSDNPTLFKYIFIIIIFLAIFQQLFVGLNIVFGLSIAVIIVIYMNSKKQYDTELKNNILKLKKDYIRPQPQRLQDYDELVDFVYSIQDFYIYNPQSYENMIDEIDNFLVLYEESKDIESLSGINYGLALKARHNAINALHSMIHKLPADNSVIDKLNRAIEQLDMLLEKYQIEMYNQNQVNLVKNGYTNSSVVINRGPKESNYFENLGPREQYLNNGKEYTYNIY